MDDTLRHIDFVNNSSLISYNNKEIINERNYDKQIIKFYDRPITKENNSTQLNISDTLRYKDGFKLLLNPSEINNKQKEKQDGSVGKFKFPLYKTKGPDVNITEKGATSINNSEIITPSTIFRSNKKNIYSEIETFKTINNENIFWLENPSVLFESFQIMPKESMNDVERLNGMTRIIIIISAIMFIIKFPGWWIFLIIGLLMVIVMWYIIKGKQELYQKEYLRRPRNPIITPIIRSNYNVVHNINNQRLNLISNPR